jgi:hypothetical protein
MRAAFLTTEGAREWEVQQVDRFRKARNDVDGKNGRKPPQYYCFPVEVVREPQSFRQNRRQVHAATHASKAITGLAVIS